MSQMIQEFVDSRGMSLRADRAAGIIRGVKVLGLASRNGRRYLPAALRQAAALYEGAKVNINHPKAGPLAPRDYQDRIGVIRAVEFRADDGPACGLYADLHFNPRHPLAEQLAWDAEHAPENVGLSHNVTAVTARLGDETVVESIEKVQSVDLVADPATTRGLFEGEGARGLGLGAREGAASASLTLEALRAEHTDLVAAIEGPLRREVASLAEELSASREKLSLAERTIRLYEEVAEHGLCMPGSGSASDARTVSQAFVELALATVDDAQRRRLIADRAAVAQTVRESRGPALRTASREQHRVEAPARCDDSASFVRAIT